MFLTRRQLFAAGSALTVNAAPLQAVDLPVSTRELWGWVRAQLILDSQITYLDTATLGPGLRSVSVTEYRQQETFNSDPEAYQRLQMTSQAVRAQAERLALLCGCDLDEVALTTGATEALNVIAHGLDLDPGDEVIIPQHAHASAIYPWLAIAARRGIVVKQVSLPSPLEDSAQALGLIAAAVTERTRVIACSHLQHTDGAILPVTEICSFARQRNILSVIDGAQACGALDVDVHAMGCDFYAASLHKWLNAPHGMGLLYVRRERLASLWPSTVNTHLGWQSINRFGQASIDADSMRADWPATWQKFGWHGLYALPRLKALGAVLDFRATLGADRIESRIRELAIYARLRLQSLEEIALLTPAQPGMWGGIVSFRPQRGSARELAERLTRNERIVVSAIEYAPLNFAAVRASFHIYNSHDDVERLARSIQKYL